jgi:hypothetical protein
MTKKCSAALAPECCWMEAVFCDCFVYSSFEKLHTKLYGIAIVGRGALLCAGCGVLYVGYFVIH